MMSDPKSDLLIQAIANLDREHRSSMSLWTAYWEARNALRDVALERYLGVHHEYLERGEDAWLPSEGFKEISADETMSMRLVKNLGPADCSRFDDDEHKRKKPPA